MAGPDPSDRFEYLFDPIAGDTTTTTTEAPAVERIVSEPQAPSRRWSLLLLAAATAAAADGAGAHERQPRATASLPQPEPEDG